MMQRAAIFSALLHILIVMISIVGLPFFNRNNELMIPTPIAVEILPVAAETQAPKPTPMPLKQDKKEEPLPPQPKPTPPPTQASEPTSPESSPEPEVKPEPKKELLPEPKPDAVPLPQPKPEPKPVESPPTPPIRPKPKEIKPVKDKVPEKSFDSILKNIAKLKPVAEVQDKAEKTNDTQSLQQVGKVGPELTMSELDALRQQIKGCWAINPGAKDIENFIVTIKILVNPDRTVREAQIIPNATFVQNGFYQSFAESALRAVLNPRCSPLKLPDGKYDQWKDLELNFSPSDLMR